MPTGITSEKARRASTSRIGICCSSAGDFAGRMGQGVSRRRRGLGPARRLAPLRSVQGQAIGLELVRVAGVAEPLGVEERELVEEMPVDDDHAVEDPVPDLPAFA